MADADARSSTLSDRVRRQVAQRLSLRRPQEDALKIFANLSDRIDWRGDVDPAALLQEISEAYPSVESFEREFPSVCYTLATGVGKTRLMGAFIAHLYLTGRSKNFFVLAPNTTIYEKLIEDFSKQSSPKYVFRGIAEFAQSPPIIVTGDTWDEGRGVRGTQLIGDAIINIFNVDKINRESGRIRSFRETLGESYFDYLANLPDLVMFMDEAHRYRAKAAAQAVFDLNPKLGIEVTATPKTVGSNPRPFKNVIYSYPLGQAMIDGYVKEPAVATRENFRRDQYDRAQLERIMLDDAATYHEHVKVELDLFARQSGKAKVHPFMLVVAEDTAHAKAVREYLESDEYKGGAYCGRVIEIHSNQTGEESNEAMARLVTLEHDAETDIVVHVNKLKEGWDVTNLYTIVPLRASASDILTEQTLGRGLRLPYGERTGNSAVDTLTVIAHDRFDAVIQEARKEGSLVRMKEIRIGEGGDVTGEPREVVAVPPPWQAPFAPTPSFLRDQQEQQPSIAPTLEQAAVATAAMQLIRDKYERQLTGGLQDLKREDVREAITRDVQQATARAQGTLEGVLPQTDVAQLVAQITASIAENSIEIPEIVVLPSREVNFWFEDFDLQDLQTIRFQPSSDKILVRNLRDEAQRELARGSDGPGEERAENYVIRHLIDFPEVDYDSQAVLLFKLAGRVIERLREYLSDEEAVEATALEHGKALARFIHAQMRDHYRETPVEYQAKRVKSFKLLGPQQFAYSGQRVLPLYQPADPLSATRSYTFAQIKKSPYPFAKFDSDPERKLAHGFERMSEVIRWLRPAPGQFDIEYAGGKGYEPDFVVESDNQKVIVEVKANNQQQDPIVQEKARAATAWAVHANSFAGEGDGKSWSYALISERDVTEALTWKGILSHCGRAVQAP